VRRKSLAIFDVCSNFFGDDIEVLVDMNAKKTWEADHWKGVLDAQEQRVEGGEHHEAGGMEGLMCLAEGIAS